MRCNECGRQLVKKNGKWVHPERTLFIIGSNNKSLMEELTLKEVLKASIIRNRKVLEELAKH